ncbi:HD-GYP domain-containing protein [Streptomyces sp. AN091965]|uniref:HD-GYP domain-containing protein n=1 Tax=Streptomyces sp. AN091965 TaxID=2927803 RepID=UPI001F6077E5|nr:HD domain-containing protein [Streptomyces sp. AN091965]MCI3932964.1 HD domain-containing protein [Streptomyces sp. AN091965]
MTHEPAGRLAAAVAAVLRGAALLTALAALGATLWRGVEEPGIALAFGALIAVGELARWGSGGEREPAPLGAAGALAYALLGESGGRATHHGVLQVVAVVVAAGLVGAVPHVALGRGPAPDALARRVLTVAFAAVCFQPLYNSGRLEDLAGYGSWYAAVVVALLALTALCDAVLAAALAHARRGWPFGPLLRDELRRMPGIGSAVCATGAVMALAVAVAGLWALPVFSCPLLLTQLAVRRYAAVRATYRQTIASLARATEIAGYTPAGHARRVADLSRAMGRELGLSGADLTVLEYAALMHDIGQLSLVDPVPAGATARLPATEQRRIALLGGAVVRQTGVAADVAVVVERQADPYREQPLTARIVRTANAYDEMAREHGPQGPLAALERLRLGTGREYQTEVVEALARALAGAPRRAR